MTLALLGQPLQTIADFSGSVKNYAVNISSPSVLSLATLVSPTLRCLKALVASPEAKSQP